MAAILLFPADAFIYAHGSQNKPITEYLKEGYAYAIKNPMVL